MKFTRLLWLENMAEEVVKIKGLKELEKRLKALPKNVAGSNLLGKALRKGANVIRDEAKATAPYDPTIEDGVHVRNQIKVRRDPNPKKKGHNEIMYVKPVYTKKYPVYYWRFLEFGTAKMPATRFMTKAFENKKFEALRVFMVSLDKLITKEARKLNK
jgi:HK97 gp10 family phage protein